MLFNLPKVLDGKMAAEAVKKNCFILHEYYQKKFKKPLCLGVLSVGDHAASRVYIQRKKTMAADLNFDFLEHSFAQNTPNHVVLHALQESLAQTNGMIVQLPIVPASDATLYLSAIPWNQDVDGLNPTCIGPMKACTPLGCWLLLCYYGIDVASKHCVIVGRSHLVGRPLAKILLDHDATITVTHSHTAQLSQLTRQADILFVATGACHLITPEYVSTNSIIIDVGIHHNTHGLTGDVHPHVYPHVQAYSPVPGGVGPMTVISLMWNTLKAGFLQKGIYLSDEKLGLWLQSHKDIPLSDASDMFE